MTSTIDPTRFADGEPVRKSDLRDTLATIRGELDHGGFYQAGIPGAIARPVADRLDDMISVKDFGAKGNGSADDSAAFQAAIDSRRTIFVPAGLYKIKTSLLLRPDETLRLVGEKKSGSGSGGGTRYARISHEPDDPNTSEPLMHREEGWLDIDGTYTDGAGNTPSFNGQAQVFFENLSFGSYNRKYSQCVDIVGCVGSVFANCNFSGGIRALTLGPSSFDVSVINCRGGNTNHHKFFDPVNDSADMDYILNKCWVFYAEGHTYFFNVNIGGGTTGVRLTGLGNVLSGGRMENMHTAIQLGGNRFTASGPEGYMAHANSIHGVRIESPQYGIILDDVKASSIRDVSIQGATGGHSIRSHPYGTEIGIWLRGNVDPNVRIENVLCHFTYSVAAVLNETPVAVWTDRHGIGGDGVKVGSQNFPLLRSQHESEPAYHFLSTTMFPNAADGARETLTAFHDLMVRGLTGLNISETTPAFAKNLGGVASPDHGASSVDVAFFSAGNKALGTELFSWSVVDDPASALEPGEYYYAISLIYPHGESSVAGLGSKYYVKTDIEARQSVKLNFRHRDFVEKRRIYRGRRPGVFEGFWETYAEDNFIDDGTKPFDGKGMPPMKPGYRIPSRHEDDANYQIVAQPSWHTTTIVTNKATGGFTIEFGTPPPDDQQTVTWLLFRP